MVCSTLRVASKNQAFSTGATCPKQHACDMAHTISPTRTLEEIVEDILRELRGPQNESATPENEVRAEVMSLVNRLRVGAQKARRGQRRAEADHAESIDNLLAELELR